MTVVVPLLFRCFAPQNRTGESVLSSGLFCCVQSGLPDDRSPRTKQSAWAFFGSERRLIMGKVSGKTHTKAQLDHWANLHNPNNKAYQADADNRANQMNPNHRSHQELTMQTAETKRIGCPYGCLTIRITITENWRCTVCQSTFSTTTTATSP